MESKSILKTITRNALVACIYLVITIATSSFSFMGIQFRIAEVLVLLCFFRRDYIIGITLGTLLSNMFSPMAIIDIPFGTLATLLSCLLVTFSPKLLIACFAPILINGVIVGLELMWFFELPFWTQFLFVSLGEATVLLALGYPLFMILARKENVRNTLGFNLKSNFKW